MREVYRPYLITLKRQPREWVWTRAHRRHGHEIVVKDCLVTAKGRSPPSCSIKGKLFEGKEKWRGSTYLVEDFKVLKFFEVLEGLEVRFGVPNCKWEQGSRPHIYPWASSNSIQKVTPPAPRYHPLRSGLSQDSRHDSNGRKNYALFGELVLGRFGLLLAQIGPWSPTNDIYRAFGVRNQQELGREARLFRQTVSQSIYGASKKGLTSRSVNPLFWNLRNAFVRGDSQGLDRELKYSFQSFILRTKFSHAVTESHKKLADLRSPYDWFPTARSMQRTIHLHVGPTNSGKTYNALKALENANTGLYAGPLRLLAHEVYSRFKAKGMPCALVTGEEQRLPERAHKYFSSCTVEMSPMGTRVDVAVIDEIQMIASEDRGWAWTQAVLGIQAKELHLCGEERAVDLIQHLCTRMGDKCIVHRYERLNPLRTMDESLKGDFSKLQKGDCVVCFTRIGLHSLKTAIERETGRRCAIVYGSLPPETRAQQAALFNDPDSDYDFLVASDAIGMGLNLEIKRVIFESVTKWDGAVFRNLSIPEIKQIGGRAGRYRTASRAINESNGRPTASTVSTDIGAPGGSPSGTPSQDNDGGSVGLVTTLDEEDLAYVQQAFKTEAEPIKAAGLFAPAFVVEQFLSNFPPDTPFSFILARLREMAKVSKQFQLCNFATLLEIADTIQDLPMTIHDRVIFMTAPASLREAGQKEVLRSLARNVAEMKVGHILDIEGIDLEILDEEPGAAGGGYDYLQRLEGLHKCITLYLWLTYRYEGVFVSQHLAFHIKSLVEEKITTHLENIGMSTEARKARRDHTRLLAQKHQKKEQRLLGDDAHLGSEMRDWKDEGGEKSPAGDGEDRGDSAADADEETHGSVILDDGSDSSGGEAARI